MRRRIQAILLSLALFGVCLAPALPVAASTDVFNKACSTSAAKSSSACSTNGSDPLGGTNGIINKVSLIIAYISGIASVIVMVAGGFMYITANGDSSKAANARKAITYALVGLVIVVSARAIIVFILNAYK
jgi:hypothetical protein